MVLYPAFVLDQMSYPPRSPQPGFVAQNLRSALQALLDAAQIVRMQTRSATGPPRLLQGPQSALLKLLRPATHRLAMRTHLPRYFGLSNSRLQQPRRLQSPLLQCLKVSLHSCQISHAGTVAQNH
jgi:hypothetical protein